MKQPTNSFRKAAILVSSLDRHGADALLDSMPEDLSARVRQAVLELDEIDQVEQQAIIAEFLQRKGAIGSGGVEIEASLARKFQAAAPTESASSSAPEPSGPFGFLHAADIETLSRLLQREQPQAAALVIAHLPPARAADVLSGFPAAYQCEVLKRLAALEEASPDVLYELETSLEHSLQCEVQASRRRSLGLSAVGAIFSAAPAELRRNLLSNLTIRDATLAENLTQTSPAISLGTEVEDDDSFEDDTDSDVLDAQWEEEAACLAQSEHPPVDFEDFPRLDNRSLAIVLKASDPRVVILALTGARPELVERLLKQVSGAEAKALRQRIESSGPLRLRDVEIAQRQLSKVAGRLAAEGKIKLPTARRFAAAA